MDPNACLRVVCEDISMGAWDEAREHAADLLTWLDGGGFAPEWSAVPGSVVVWLLRVFVQAGEGA